MAFPQFGQKAIDAIRWLIANVDALKALLAERSGGTRNGTAGAQPVASRGVNTPQVSTGSLLAMINLTEAGIGYYRVTLYRRDPLLFAIATNMTTAKLGTANRSRHSIGYGYSLGDMGASAHLLAPGDVYRCEITGTHTDGKPIAELFGNPIGYIICEED